MRILTIILSMVCVSLFAEYNHDKEVKNLEGVRVKAEQGDSDSQFRLGRAYDTAWGMVTGDKIEAVKWYRKSAYQGNAEAQFYLGVCYEVGKGVLKDKVEAYAYYNLSGITFSDSRRRRDDLEKLMTPSQIEEGDKRTKQLQKEIEDKKNPKWWQITK